MTDSERAKPEYGEYASKEEQAAAMERFGPAPRPEGVSSDTGAARQMASPRDGGRDERSTRPASARSDAVRPSAGRIVDRIATVFMLSFGFVYVLSGFSTYLNFADSLQTMVHQMGLGDYHPTSQTAGIGVAILVSQALVWLIAAVWSFRRILRSKTTWWVPLSAGVVTIVVSSILIGILLAADPALLASFQKP